MRYFRSMHFTSESFEGTHKQLLRFVFKLPPKNQMGAISKLIDLVPMFIDIGEERLARPTETGMERVLLDSRFEPL